MKHSLTLKIVNLGDYKECNLKEEYDRKEIVCIKKFLEDINKNSLYPWLYLNTKVIKKIEKFKIGDKVTPRSGCNKDIPCVVIKTWIVGEKQFIAVKPINENDILKGYRASRLKVNEHSGAAKSYKFLKGE